MSSTSPSARIIYTTTITPALRDARRQLRTLSLLVALLCIWLFVGLANSSIDPELSTELNHPLGSLTHWVAATLMSTFGIVSYSLCFTLGWSSTLIWNYRRPTITLKDAGVYLVFLALCAAHLEVSLPAYKLFGAPLGGVIGESLGGLFLKVGVFPAQVLISVSFLALFALKFNLYTYWQSQFRAGESRSSRLDARPVKSLAHGEIDIQADIFGALGVNTSAPHLTDTSFEFEGEEASPYFLDDRDLLPSEPIEGDPRLTGGVNMLPPHSSDPIFDFQFEGDLGPIDGLDDAKRSSSEGSPLHIFNLKPNLKQEPRATGATPSPFAKDPRFDVSLSVPPQESPVAEAHDGVSLESVSSSSRGDASREEKRYSSRYSEGLANLPAPRVSRSHILESALIDLNLTPKLLKQAEGKISDSLHIRVTAPLDMDYVQLLKEVNIRIQRVLGKSEPPLLIQFRQLSGYVDLYCSWPRRNAPFPSANDGIKEVRRLGEEDPLNLYLGEHSSGVQAHLPFSQISSLLIAAGQHVELNVGLDLILTNLIYQASPQELRLLVIDPVSETSPFHGLPHLYSPILNEDRHVTEVLEWLSVEYRRRLSQLSRIGAQSFNEYLERSQESWMRLVLVVPDLKRLSSLQLDQLSLCVEKLERSPHDLGLHLIMNAREINEKALPSKLLDHVKVKVAFATDNEEESAHLRIPGAEYLLNKHDMLLEVSDGVHRIHGWQFTHSSFIRILNVFAATVPVEYVSRDRVFIQTIKSLQNQAASVTSKDRLSSRTEIPSL
jgi:hypothetical protein